MEIMDLGARMKTTGNTDDSETIETEIVTGGLSDSEDE